jgi:hypothetical protein
MSRITVVDNEYATSWCYTKKKIIHHQFHKFTYGEDFRDVMNKNTDVYEAHGCNKWLSDDRNVGVLHPDDKAWGDANWLPRVMAAGWKYWALVLPVSVTGQMSLKQLVDEFSEIGIIVKVFDDPDEAMTWLEAQGT